MSVEKPVDTGFLEQAIVMALKMKEQSSIKSRKFIIFNVKPVM
jgi:hypothetical protein